jgi:hypothetical protein
METATAPRRAARSARADQLGGGGVVGAERGRGPMPHPAVVGGRDDLRQRQVDLLTGADRRGLVDSRGDQRMTEGDPVAGQPD